ncbi:MAG TPA: SprT family zinc-dependent metalloprotease [Longimicrobiales bacterium]|nr:SprT family zinc-dependent metalloprotease [Longimicrobiales bacterium]
MRARSGEDTLRELKNRGALRLKSVNFRANRSTIWSLTQSATVLNLHVAYRRAPSSVLDAFATIVRGRGWKTAAVREASAVVQNWSGLTPVMEAVRTSHAIRLRQSARRCGDDDQVTHCCATPEQKAYLKAVYRYLNKTRFDGLLPADVPVRLSNRMTASLGHMIPGRDRKRGRFIIEIALNVDLMLEGNGAERMDTLLHEMAHVADWMLEGEYGHGGSWRRWARHAGCRAETKYDRPVVRRRRRAERVTRVPPLPPALRRRAA